MWRAHRFSGIHHHPFSRLIYVLRSACGSDCFQETIFEYVEGGHGGSGTQGTLWSLQIWGPFLSWGWASHGSLALPDVWRPGSFLCLILLSPLVIASVLGLEFDLECFRTPREKNRKLAMEIELAHPQTHTLTHTLHPPPINARTPGHDLEALSVFDGHWVFFKWFKRRVA